mmetsp:Transcript_14155/g.17887  ORF Transcript_14155/g.17887 Transcript_14155/m.17887 type:complete len:114 (-) Transcript_14155:117-458(-)
MYSLGESVSQIGEKPGLGTTLDVNDGMGLVGGIGVSDGIKVGARLGVDDGERDGFSDDILSQEGTVKIPEKVFVLPFPVTSNMASINDGSCTSVIDPLHVPLYIAMPPRSVRW